MTDTYVYKNQKKLRCGYTTGSCAAGAAKAGTRMLLTGEVLSEVQFPTPKGTRLRLRVEKIERMEETVTCAIQKDSGDDADVTNGILIYADVSRIARGIIIDGGEGIGRVTQSGLNQPVGNAAINDVPRKMIEQSVQEEMDLCGYEGGIQVIISAPEGIKIAEKTFNPRLGIQGGISILGTSGIVEPMSEQALLDTIRMEIKQKAYHGKKDLLVIPGNYGETFLKKELKIEVSQAIKCSNFIGDTIDMAYEYQIRSFLLIGHIGKLVKLGAGIMNTHSKMADGRMEVLASCAIRADVGNETIKKILDCITTEEAIALLKEEDNRNATKLLEDTLQILMKRINYYLQHRAYEGLQIGAILFSNQHGLLGMTEDAEKLLVPYTK